MTANSSNVDVAVTGAVYAGPTSADAPTSTGSAVDTDFVDLGYIDEKGVTESRSRSTKDVPAWQNGAVVRTLVTDGKITYKFRMIETSKAVLELYYGATTAGATSTDGRLDIVPTSTGGRKSFLIDTIDGPKLTRRHIPSGEVTEVSDLSLVSNDATGYEVTITAYPVNGVPVSYWSTALKTGA